LVCRSGNAHRNGSDSQCKNECNFAHHHTLPLLLRVGYMADLQSSVCDNSATTPCFHRAWHARFLPLSGGHRIMLRPQFAGALERGVMLTHAAYWRVVTNPAARRRQSSRIRCRPSFCTMTAPAGHPESHRP
jgi:hypothetical protein